MFDGAAFGKEMVGIVRGYVDRALSPLLKRLDDLEGRSVGVSEDAARQMIADAVTKAIAELPAPTAPAEPWRPTDDELRALMQPMFDALPKPEHGKSVTIEDVQPIIAEYVEKAVAALPVAKDGVGLAGAVIDRAGQLVVTLTDGGTKELGVVVGRDVDETAVESRIKQLVDAIPPARDGVDGMGFDDMTAEYDGERGIVLRFVRGEQVKEFAFTMPVVIDRGVWVEGKEYAAGDAVTWGGSLWIAQKSGAVDKPDGGDSWRLAVKRGRDGKPGKDGELKVHQPVKVP